MALLQRRVYPLPVECAVEEPLLRSSLVINQQHIFYMKKKKLVWLIGIINSNLPQYLIFHSLINHTIQTSNYTNLKSLG